MWVISNFSLFPLEKLKLDGELKICESTLTNNLISENHRDKY